MLQSTFVHPSPDQDTLLAKRDLDNSRKPHKEPEISFLHTLVIAAQWLSQLKRRLVERKAKVPSERPAIASVTKSEQKVLIVIKRIGPL